MLFWIIKIAIISAIIIYLIHNILHFLFDALTVPKVKDLVQITNKNYKNICDILTKNQNQPNHNQNQNIIDIDPFDLNISATPISLLPTSDMNANISETNDAKLELKNYLKEEFR